MKLNKTQLKSIIKECLIEILTEGIGDLNESVKSQSVVAKKQQNSPKKQMQYQQVQKNMMQSVVKNSAGGNPIMESILADTASTTFLQQQSAEKVGTLESMVGDRETRIVAQNNPEDLFGEEASQNWLQIMDKMGIQ